MSDKKAFYITSPIFYPNANLHLGHVYSMTLCDILARYERGEGREARFLTGADENTSTVIKAAEALGKSVSEYLEDIGSNFEKLFRDINASNDVFIRTTDKDKHWVGAQKLWRALEAAGDIYKAKYTGHYCPNCAAFYTEKELVDGKCPIHHTEPEKLEEDNYFFKLSKYTGAIKQKIESGEFQIVPETRKNEILALLDRGLDDVSFSRPKDAVPHAIPVPSDDSQVMYVWCDALASYITGIGYGSDDESFNKYWPADVHLIGKDILRFHAAIWPAMLLSAGLPLPKKLFVHGFILSGGQKMSKTLGNVIDPYELINEYGADAVRYYLARKISPFEDGDITREGFKDAYNGDLANGLGNLTSRILKLAESNLPQAPALDLASHGTIKSHLEEFEIQKAMNHIWSEIGELDRFIQEKKPWESKDKEVITSMVQKLAHIAHSLAAFMPETSEKILSAIKSNRMPAPLFARKDA